MKPKTLFIIAAVVVAYVVYETYIQPAVGGPTFGSPANSTYNPDANPDMGGLDFGVLDPSNYD